MVLADVLTLVPGTQPITCFHVGEAEPYFTGMAHTIWDECETDVQSEYCIYFDVYRHTKTLEFVTEPMGDADG